MQTTIDRSEAERRLAANREKVHDLIRRNLAMTPTQTAAETRVWLSQQDQIDALFRESDELIELAYPRCG
jgi:hypothetical protein